MKLFIGGIPYSATEEQITELFSPHGELKDVHLAMDKETGKSTGFAFVTLKSYKQGEGAIEALKVTKMDCRKLTIQESKPKGGGRQNNRGRGRRDRR